jgi:hypothetical protein
MGGGLMQLVAYGAQDIYLTGNPQITFFKVVYRRHTNFSMESIQQTFNGNATFGGDATATISRNGDLVYRMYLEHEANIVSADASDDVAIGCDYGSHLMKEMELEIGGQRIDRQYGHWHSVYSQLTEYNPSHSNTTLFNRMTGNGIGANDGLGSVNGWTFSDTDHTGTGKFWIPLYFWFCRNPGLALPLIALQYHEVKVKITFEEVGNLAIENHDDDESDFAAGTQAKATAGAGNTFNLWCDYIYLDTDERRRFAQVSHEYLIEQVQYENKSGGSMDLNFNHPVKELIWAGIRGSVADHAGETNADDLYQRAKLSNAVTDTFQLKLNGHDRFKERDSRYFTRTQIWEHHTGYGDTQISAGTTLASNIVTDTIAVYSFALKPEEHQPSGTCNFSRIDNAQLVQGGTSAVAVNVYAVNYNVLRIMSGMGGLAYSN